MLLLVGMLAGYRYLLPDSDQVDLPLVQNCRLHTDTCFSALPAGGSIRLEIEPKRPAPTDPLRVTAVFDEAIPKSVGIRLKGVDMDMGYLEHFVYDLVPDLADPSGRTFSGSAGVFACSSTVMQWHVLARVEVGEARYEIPFQFETRQK